MLFNAPSDLQSHYGNGVFGNVYLLALNSIRDKHCWCPIAVMGVVDHLGHRVDREPWLTSTPLHHCTATEQSKSAI